LETLGSMKWYVRTADDVSWCWCYSCVLVGHRNAD
jgi:hypothetical protein